MRDCATTERGSACVGVRGIGFAAAVTRALLIDRAAVVVVLQRKILSPDGGIIGLVVQFHDAEERILRLLFVLKNRDEKDHAEDRARAGEDDERGENGDRTAAVKVQQTFSEGEFAHRRLLPMANIGVAADA